MVDLSVLCIFMENISAFVPRNEHEMCTSWVEPCVQPYIDRVLPYSLISKLVEYLVHIHVGITLLALVLADTFNEWSDTTQHLTGILVIDLQHLI